MDTSERRSEIPGKFSNVVLEKDGEQFDRSCEKRSINILSRRTRNILHTINRRKADWIGHILRRNCLLNHVMEGEIQGRVEGTGRRGRIRGQLLDEMKEKRGYWKLK